MSSSSSFNNPRVLREALAKVLCVQPLASADVHDLWMAIGEMRRVCAEALTDNRAPADVASVLEAACGTVATDFKALPVGAVFEFDHSGLSSWSGAVGPWRKTSARKVGTVRVSVIPSAKRWPTEAELVAESDALEAARCLPRVITE